MRNVKSTAESGMDMITSNETDLNTRSFLMPSTTATGESTK